MEQMKEQSVWSTEYMEHFKEALAYIQQKQGYMEERSCMDVDLKVYYDRNIRDNEGLKEAVMLQSKQEFHMYFEFFEPWWNLKLMRPSTTQKQLIEGKFDMEQAKKDVKECVCLKWVSFAMEAQCINAEKVHDLCEHYENLLKCKTADAELLDIARNKRVNAEVELNAAHGATKLNILKFQQMKYNMQQNGNTYVEAVKKLTLEFSEFMKENMENFWKAFPVAVAGRVKGLRAVNGDLLGEFSDYKDAEAAEYEEKLCRNRSELVEAVTMKNMQQHCAASVEKVDEAFAKIGQEELDDVDNMMKFSKKLLKDSFGTMVKFD